MVPQTTLLETSCCGSIILTNELESKILYSDIEQLQLSVIKLELIIYIAFWGNYSKFAILGLVPNLCKDNPQSPIKLSPILNLCVTMSYD